MTKNNLFSLRTIFTIIISSIAITSFAQSDTLRLKVMTYNIRFGELASMEQIGQHIKAFNPDFVALQEVDIHMYRDLTPHQHGVDFMTALAKETGMFPLYGKAVAALKGYFGVGILSKYPYISVEKLMLPNPNNVEPRVLLSGTFEVGNDTVIFATTHLDVTSEQNRVLQTQYICDYFKDCKYPVLLGGDFNAKPQTDSLKKVMKKSWLEFTNDDFTFPTKNPKAKLDYIFARPMLGWSLIRTQAIQSQLSDHLPIITELQYIRNK